MDRITPEQRSYTMRAVKSKDSAIELRLRKELWHKGYRYRKHYLRLPGKPDIAFVSRRVVVFCDSEFWHGHDWERRKHDIKSNHEFWYKKIERNMERDCEVTTAIEQLGWTVLRFWGKEIINDLDRVINSIEAVLNAPEHRLPCR